MEAQASCHRAVNGNVTASGELLIVATSRVRATARHRAHGRRQPQRTQHVSDVAGFQIPAVRHTAAVSVTDHAAVRVSAAG